MAKTIPLDNTSRMMYNCGTESQGKRFYDIKAGGFDYANG